jgi:hypothetical protein
MPEYRRRRHWPRCRCPAKLVHSWRFFLCSLPFFPFIFLFYLVFVSEVQCFIFYTCAFNNVFSLFFFKYHGTAFSTLDTSLADARLVMLYSRSYHKCREITQKSAKLIWECSLRSRYGRKIERKTETSNFL